MSDSAAAAAALARLGLLDRDPESEPSVVGVEAALGEALPTASAGARLGCKEALFSLGEKPELAFPEARRFLTERGHRTTIEYLASMCQLTLAETGLLPHANPGTMTIEEMAMLREANASMGLMLESVSARLMQPGGPHHPAPDKRPRLPP